MLNSLKFMLPLPATEADTQAIKLEKIKYRKRELKP